MCALDEDQVGEFVVLPALPILRWSAEQTRDLIYGMLETTLGGMVCALDEDQVGEFVVLPDIALEC